MLRKIILVPTIASIIFTAGILTVGAQSATPTQTPPTGLACMQIAVQKRESALQAALETFLTDWKNIFQARSSALATAWGISDGKQRTAAIKAANKAYESDLKTARLTMRNANKDTWNQFTKDRKSCRIQDLAEKLQQMRDSNR